MFEDGAGRLLHFRFKVLLDSVLPLVVKRYNGNTFFFLQLMLSFFFWRASVFFYS